MQNLKLKLINVKALPLQNISHFLQIDENNYLIVDDGSVFFTKGEKELFLGEKIIRLEYLPIQNLIFMSNKDKFSCYNIDTDEFSFLDVPGGFIVYKWNPTQDRIAYVNSEGILRVATFCVADNSCLVHSTYELYTDEKSRFINIGWGSQETQFKGSAGKHSHARTEEDGNSTEDRSVKISWREEGDMFAVSYSNNNCRAFKVFSADGHFLYKSEYKVGLGSELTWKLDGSLICIEGDSPQGRKLLFFEKNGLYRYEHKIHSNLPIKKIRWNGNGDIILVWQGNEYTSEISLLTSSSAKWYMKQNLIFDDSDVQINDVEWVDDLNFQVLTNTKLLSYYFMWSRDISNLFTYKEEDLGSLILINGSTLYVTILSRHIMPPPLCSYEMKFDKPVCDIVFGATSNKLLVVLNDCTVKLLELSAESGIELASFKLNPTFPLSLNRFIFNDKHSMICCINYNEDGTFIFDNYTLNIIQNTYQTEQNKSVCLPNLKFYDLIPIFEPHEEMFRLGLCYENSIEIVRLLKPNFMISNFISLEEDSGMTFNHFIMGGLTTVYRVQNGFHVLSLHENRLQINNNYFIPNVSSYLFTSRYLMFTTFANKLFCLKLTDIENLYNGNRHLDSFYSRSIPNGATILSQVPNSRKLILSIPRGELEIINPRLLAIDIIDKLLDEKKHLEAYNVLRVDRINPNLFYDINPQRFLNDVEEFIVSIKDCDKFDVFLMSLVNENLTQSLYKNCFDGPLPKQDCSNKISIIANKFIDTMAKLDIDYYLQTILTAYKCKGTEDDFKKALMELNSARIRERNGIKLRMPVEDTLKYFLQFTSIEIVYDIALLLDDMELTLWVLSKSQKDPSEYMPFLQEISLMEPNYRNYKINNHTKHYEEAFRYLIKCNDIFEELKELVSKQLLYNIILKYVDKDNKWYIPLLKLYVDYLVSKNLLKEAGIIYYKLGQDSLRNALHCFCESGYVTQALLVFHEMNVKNLTAEITQMLSVLVSRLIDQKQYKEASYVCDKVMHNNEEAVSVLVAGHLWMEAYNLAMEYARSDLIETEIKPAIVNYADILINTFKTTEEDYTKAKTRLRKLREETTPYHLPNSDRLFEDNFDPASESLSRQMEVESLVSTRYSQASLHSKSSQRTSTTIRKQKRIAKKILSAKMGSEFENIALIRQLYLQIDATQNLSEKIRSICLFFVMFPEYTNLCMEIQNYYEQILTLMQSTKEEIWPKDFINPPEVPTVESKILRLNINYLDTQFHQPPGNMSMDWKIML